MRLDWDQIKSNITAVAAVIIMLLPALQWWSGRRKEKAEAHKIESESGHEVAGRDLTLSEASERLVTTATGLAEDLEKRLRTAEARANELKTAGELKFDSIRQRYEIQVEELRKRFDEEIEELRQANDELQTRLMAVMEEISSDHANLMQLRDELNKSLAVAHDAQTTSEIYMRRCVEAYDVLRTLKTRYSWMMSGICPPERGKEAEWMMGGFSLHGDCDDQVVTDKTETRKHPVIKPDQIA